MFFKLKTPARTSPVVFLLALFLIFSSSVEGAEFSRTRAERVGMSSERLARLDEIMKSYVDAQSLAGQVILVLREGRIVYSTANGMRNINANLPMTEDTIFRIASQTKAIVSTGIMILQEQGKLDINHRLSRYIPEWSEMQVAVADGQGGYSLEPARRQITLRHLLTHTGGMSYGSGPAAQAWAAAGFAGWYFADKDETILDSVRRMAALPLDEHPGESWIYGYNTDILGAVIEVVSGMDLASFLQQEIFDPLQMRDTHFYLPREKADRLAVVYRPSDNGVEAIPSNDGMQSQGLYVQGQGPNRSYSGGAGLLSTAGDYARFLQMTLNGGELDGVRILSPNSIALMTVNHLGEIPYRSGVGFGLGYSVVTDFGARGTPGSEGEYGWLGAYHSTYWVDPQQDLVVVYLTQLIPSNGLDDFNKLRNGIYQAIIE